MKFNLKRISTTLLLFGVFISLFAFAQGVEAQTCYYCSGPEGNGTCTSAGSSYSNCNGSYSGEQLFVSSDCENSCNGYHYHWCDPDTGCSNSKTYRRYSSKLDAATAINKYRTDKINSDDVTTASNCGGQCKLYQKCYQGDKCTGGEWSMTHPDPTNKVVIPNCTSDCFEYKRCDKYATSESTKCTSPYFRYSQTYLRFTDHYRYKTATCEADCEMYYKCDSSGNQIDKGYFIEKPSGWQSSKCVESPSETTINCHTCAGTTCSNKSVTGVNPTCSSKGYENGSCTSNSCKSSETTINCHTCAGTTCSNKSVTGVNPTCSSQGYYSGSCTSQSCKSSGGSDYETGKVNKTHTFWSSSVYNGQDCIKRIGIQIICEDGKVCHVTGVKYHFKTGFKNYLGYLYDTMTHDDMDNIGSGIGKTFYFTIQTSKSGTVSYSLEDVLDYIEIYYTDASGIKRTYRINNFSTSDTKSMTKCGGSGDGGSTSDGKITSARITNIDRVEDDPCLVYADIELTCSEGKTCKCYNRPTIGYGVLQVVSVAGSAVDNMVGEFGTPNACQYNTLPKNTYSNGVEYFSGVETFRVQFKVPNGRYTLKDLLTEFTTWTYADQTGKRYAWSGTPWGNPASIVLSINPIYLNKYTGATKTESGSLSTKTVTIDNCGVSPVVYTNPAKVDSSCSTVTGYGTIGDIKDFNDPKSAEIVLLKKNGTSYTKIDSCSPDTTGKQKSATVSCNFANFTPTNGIYYTQFIVVNKHCLTGKGSIVPFEINCGDVKCLPPTVDYIHDIVCNTNSAAKNADQCTVTAGVKLLDSGDPANNEVKYYAWFNKGTDKTVDDYDLSLAKGEQKTFTSQILENTAYYVSYKVENECGKTATLVPPESPYSGQDCPGDGIRERNLKLSAKCIKDGSAWKVVVTEMTFNGIDNQDIFSYARYLKDNNDNTIEGGERGITGSLKDGETLKDKAFQKPLSKGIYKVVVKEQKGELNKEETVVCDDETTTPNCKFEVTPIYKANGSASGSKPCNGNLGFKIEYKSQNGKDCSIVSGQKFTLIYFLDTENDISPEKINRTFYWKEGDGVEEATAGVSNGMIILDQRNDIQCKDISSSACYDKTVNIGKKTDENVLTPGQVDWMDPEPTWNNVSGRFYCGEGTIYPPCKCSRSNGLYNIKGSCACYEFSYDEIEAGIKKQVEGIQGLGYKFKPSGTLNFVSSITNGTFRPYTNSNVVTKMAVYLDNKFYKLVPVTSFLGNKVAFDVMASGKDVAICPVVGLNLQYGQWCSNPDDTVINTKITVDGQFEGFSTANPPTTNIEHKITAADKEGIRKEVYPDCGCDPTGEGELYVDRKWTRGECTCDGKLTVELECRGGECKGFNISHAFNTIAGISEKSSAANGEAITLAAGEKKTIELDLQCDRTKGCVNGQTLYFGPNPNIQYPTVTYSPARTHYAGGDLVDFDCRTNCGDNDGKTKLIVEPKFVSDGDCTDKGVLSFELTCTKGSTKLALDKCVSNAITPTFEYKIPQDQGMKISYDATRPYQYILAQVSGSIPSVNVICDKAHPSYEVCHGKENLNIADTTKIEVLDDVEVEYKDTVYNFKCVGVEGGAWYAMAPIPCESKYATAYSSDLRGYVCAEDGIVKMVPITDFQYTLSPIDYRNQGIVHAIFTKLSTIAQENTKDTYYKGTITGAYTADTTKKLELNPTDGKCVAGKTYSLRAGFVNSADGVRGSTIGVQKGYHMYEWIRIITPNDPSKQKIGEHIADISHFPGVLLNDTELTDKTTKMTLIGEYDKCVEGTDFCGKNMKVTSKIEKATGKIYMDTWYGYQSNKPSDYYSSKNVPNIRSTFTITLSPEKWVWALYHKWHFVLVNEKNEIVSYDGNSVCVSPAQAKYYKSETIRDYSDNVEFYGKRISPEGAYIKKFTHEFEAVPNGKYRVKLLSPSFACDYISNRITAPFTCNSSEYVSDWITISDSPFNFGDALCSKRNINGTSNSSDEDSNKDLGTHGTLNFWKDNVTVKNVSCHSDYTLKLDLGETLKTECKKSPLLETLIIRCNGKSLASLQVDSKCEYLSQSVKGTRFEQAGFKPGDEIVCSIFQANTNEPDNQFISQTKREVQWAKEYLGNVKLTVNYTCGDEDEEDTKEKQEEEEDKNKTTTVDLVKYTSNSTNGTQLVAKVNGATSKSGLKPHFIIYPAGKEGALNIEAGHTDTLNIDNEFSFDAKWLDMSGSGFCVKAVIEGDDSIERCFTGEKSSNSSGSTTPTTPVSQSSYSSGSTVNVSSLSPALRNLLMNLVQ